MSAPSSSPPPVKEPRASLKLNALSNLAVMFLGVVTQLIVTPAMLRHLGEARYGMWTLTTSLVGYFSVLQFGLSAAIFRHVPLYRGRGETQRVSGVISSSLAFYGAIGILSLGALFAWAQPLAAFFGGGPELAGLVRIVGIAFAFDLASIVLNAAVKGYEGFAFVNIVTAFTLVLRAALLFGCVWYGYGLIGMAWALVIVRGIALIGQWIAFKRQCEGVEISPRHARWSELKALLVFGGVIALASTANALAIEAPKQIVGKVLSLEALGIFGVPAMLLGQFRQFVFNLTRVLSPRFSFLSGQERDAQIGRLFLKSSRYTAAMVTGLSLAFWICGPAFLMLWTKRPQMAQGIGVLLALTAGNWILLSHRVASDLFLGLGHKKQYALIEMIEAALIMALIVPLAKLHGLTGAAIAMALPFIVIRGIVQPIITCRLIGVPLPLYYGRCILKSWLIGLALAATHAALGGWSWEFSWPGLLLRLAAFSSAFAALAWIFVATSDERAAALDRLRHFTRRRLKLA